MFDITNNRIEELKIYATVIIKSIYRTNSIESKILIDDINEYFGGKVKYDNIIAIVNSALPPLLNNTYLFNNNKLTESGELLATNPNARLG